MTVLVFVVGVVIFAITVYGTVMAGGIELTKREVKQNANRPIVPDAADFDSALRSGVRY